MAKGDMVENVRAVYGNYTAEQMRRSNAITLVEIVIVDSYGNERVLNPIRESPISTFLPISLGQLSLKTFQLPSGAESL